MKKDYDSNTNTNNKSAATLANALNEILNNANLDLTKLNKIKSLFSASGTNGTNIADSFMIKEINADNPKGGIVTFILSENPGYEIANNNLTSEKTISFNINYSDGTLYVPSVNPPALK